MLRRPDVDPFERYTYRAAEPARHPSAFVLSPTVDGQARISVTHLTLIGPPAPFGETGLSAEVSLPDRFAPAILMLPFDTEALKGIDLLSIRVFSVEAGGGKLRPIWRSGVNTTLGFVWARLPGPGSYRAIGLPRDVLLRGALRDMAWRRRYFHIETAEDSARITSEALALLREAPAGDLQELRRVLTYVEVQTGPRTFGEAELQRSHGFHLAPFPLPGSRTLRAFRELLGRLETPDNGFPEEELFFDPGLLADPKPPWSDLQPPFPFPLQWPIPVELPDWLRSWSVSKDWWMYHHDERHTGHASGISGIRSTTVGSLLLRHAVAVDGPVITIPTVVHGKVYVGSSDAPGGGGTLYKIDLASGVVEQKFTVPSRFPAYSQGIGGSPAVVDGRVYFTTIPGMVHCLDRSTFAVLWSVDLRNPDPAHNQPVKNHAWTDSWSSPLVIGNRVYVGCGEGEGGAWGFVYCLHAHTGDVVWLFCTNKFTSAADNSPNVIPVSAVGTSPLPAGFSSAPDPPYVGVSVWSSLAYDHVHRRVWVGTGNATFGDFNPLPDQPYGSGVLALDADTGTFAGFFEPSAADCYRANDTDVDICGSPTIFTKGGKTMVGIGSKSGAYFILDGASLAVHAHSNMLPYKNDDPAQPLPGVDAHTGPAENFYGVFGTAAVDRHRHRLYVCIGGYGGAIDSATTPFIRALHSDTLDDAWAGHRGSDGVWRYTVPVPPLYTTPNEAGLGSPAIVNDVVLVPTSKPGLYALDADSGLCLWSATGLSGSYVLGPAVYGNHVILGCGTQVRIYAT
jgi:outer membrane protein assembly factor BamB